MTIIPAQLAFIPDEINEGEAIPSVIEWYDNEDHLTYAQASEIFDFTQGELQVEQVMSDQAFNDKYRNQQNVHQIAI